jgi:hypothetical protein
MEFVVTPCIRLDGKVLVTVENAGKAWLPVDNVAVCSVATVFAVAACNIPGGEKWLTGSMSAMKAWLVS